SGGCPSARCSTGPPGGSTPTSRACASPARTPRVAATSPMPCSATRTGTAGSCSRSPNGCPAGNESCRADRLREALGQARIGEDQAARVVGQPLAIVEARRGIVVALPHALVVDPVVVLVQPLHGEVLGAYVHRWSLGRLPDLQTQP